MSEVPFHQHKMSQNKYKDIAPSLLFGFTIISIFHWSTGVLTFNCEVRRQNEVKAIIYLLDIHKLLQNAKFCASTSSFCLKHTSAKQAILTDVVGLSVEKMDKNIPVVACVPSQGAMLLLCANAESQDFTFNDLFS